MCMLIVFGSYISKLLTLLHSDAESVEIVLAASGVPAEFAVIAVPALVFLISVLPGAMNAHFHVFSEK